MTNYRVGPCRNNFLVRGHGNRCGRKRILLEHKEDDEKSELHQEVARDHECQRNRRPRKAMIERRKDQGTHEYEGRQKLYQLLGFFILGSRTCVDSALEELRVLLP